MPFLVQSTKTVQTARQEIADTAGASADTEMLTRAGRSLDAAIKHFNNKANWEWLWTEGTPIGVSAPFGASVSATAGVASAHLASGHGILVDDIIKADVIGLGTRVSATATTALGFNQAIPASMSPTSQVVAITAVRDIYDFPSDYKAIYSVRLLSAQRTLRLLRRRLYDRSVTDEFLESTPYNYDLSLAGNRGKIRIIPPPSAGDTMIARYYRRMTVSTATGDTLDIPQDYDDYLVAYGKWHFLTDKAEGRGEQAGVWLQVANEGLLRMQAEQTRIPDEDLGFVPGHYFHNVVGANSPYFTTWR